MHGLYLWWWVQERQVPAAAVAAILAAGDLTVTALEVPTGWLADRVGHRASLIAGSLLQIAGMLAAWLGAGIPGVLTSSLVIAAGDAFRSGADQALLYRSCAAVSRERDFQAIEARTQAVQLLALVLLVLSGGAIVSNGGFAAGWIVETSMSIAGLLIAFAMVEPPATRSAATVRARKSDARVTLAPALVMRVLPASLLGAVASALSFVAQTRGASGPSQITALVALITLAEAAGAALAARIVAGDRMQRLLAACGAVIAILPAFVPAALGASAVMLSLLMGLAFPLRASAIQRTAADDARAQSASVASACDKACLTVALVVAGALPRRPR